MDLEIARLDLRYQELRTRSAERERRLVGSLHAAGQQTPIVVVRDGDRDVVVDGYKRVRALRRLGRDLVRATTWDLGELDALLLERHGHLRLDESVRARVLGASAATIDRLLAEPRAAARGRPPRRTSARPSIRAGVPVRTFADWKDPAPGSMEADLVAHCGTTVEGSFVHTLVLTDIATTWTECVPIVVREGTLIVDALGRLRESMPFPLLSFDTDNGSEFINETVVAFCAKHGIEFTRSRPYRKNDQAWVEQKNGSIVRRLVGYGRLEGLVAAETLARLYTASRLFVNFFQPSFELAEKTRVVDASSSALPLAGAAVRAPAGVPSDRRGGEGAPQRRASGARSARLLDEIRAEQHQLAALIAGTPIRVPPTSNAPLADAQGPTGDRVALDSIVARSRARSDGQGTARAPSVRPAGGLRRRPTADDAAACSRVARRSVEETGLRTGHRIRRRSHARDQRHRSGLVGRDPDEASW